MKKNKNNLKEPFVRIVKRDNIKFQNIILIYSIAIVGGLLLSGLIKIWETSLNPCSQVLLEANANSGSCFKTLPFFLVHQWHCFPLLK